MGLIKENANTSEVWLRSLFPLTPAQVRATLVEDEANGPHNATIVQPDPKTN